METSQPSPEGPWGGGAPPYQPPPLTPFEQWLAPARPKAKFWRLVIGFVIVMLVWMVWSALMVGLAFVQHISEGSISPGMTQESMEAALYSIIEGRTMTDVIALMASFWGIWIGVWLAIRICHQRKTRTIIAAPKGFKWSGFLFGMLLIGVYILIGAGLSIFVGGMPAYRSELQIKDWVTWLIPLAILIAIQSSGEELFFRGYLVQNLAARVRNPLVWALIPAALFGLGHYANVEDPTFAAYYVASTVLIALVFTAVVWRTGSLAVVMGMHTANNLVAFLVVGPDESMASTQIWLVKTEEALGGAPFDLAALVLLLVYVISPLAPFPGKPLIGRRNDTRAAP